MIDDGRIWTFGAAALLAAAGAVYSTASGSAVRLGPLFPPRASTELPYAYHFTATPDVTRWHNTRRWGISASIGIEQHESESGSFPLKTAISCLPAFLDACAPILKADRLLEVKAFDAFVTIERYVTVYGNSFQRTFWLLPTTDQEPKQISSMKPGNSQNPKSRYYLVKIGGPFSRADLLRGLGPATGSTVRLGPLFPPSAPSSPEEVRIVRRSGVWLALRGDRQIGSGWFDSPTGYPRQGGSGKGCAVKAGFRELGFKNRISDARLQILLEAYPNDADLRIDSTGGLHVLVATGSTVRLGPLFRHPAPTPPGGRVVVRSFARPLPSSTYASPPGPEAIWPVIEVEVDIIEKRLPRTAIVGLPAGQTQETAERVRSAIEGAGFEFPRKRIIVNVRPADLKKRGRDCEFPIAMGILLAAGLIPPLQETAGPRNDLYFIGELSSTGHPAGVPIVPDPNLAPGVIFMGHTQRIPGWDKVLGRGLNEFRYPFRIP